MVGHGRTDNQAPDSGSFDARSLALSSGVLAVSIRDSIFASQISLSQNRWLHWKAGGGGSRFVRDIQEDRASLSAVTLELIP